ncbi:MAG: carboxypeptidase-like regulatory domain-containing protein [Acidobacteriota bacterium]
MLAESIARAVKSKKAKRAALVCLGLALALILLLWPGLPWSSRVHRSLRRASVKAQIKLAEWRGHDPREALLRGRVSGSEIEAFKGARITAIESPSGYGALTDAEGKFLLPHLVWYPNARFTLTVTTSDHQSKEIRVIAPALYPDTGVIDAGDLLFADGEAISQSEPGVRRMDYDAANDSFYRDLFDKITADAETDHEKIDAINRYAASKLDYGVKAQSFDSPRQILEGGAAYCVFLAEAMGAITEAGYYPTRIVHLTDSPEYLHTHTVVEVYYGGGWHIYDPTYRVHYPNHQNVAASYAELRLDPTLIKREMFEKFDPKIYGKVFDWMPGVYQSGIHQIYHITR